MTIALDTDTVLGALTSAITEVCGLEANEIAADALFGELEVDSLGAIEIAVLVGDALDVRVDLQDLVQDWTHLTIGELAGNLAGALRRKNPGYAEQAPPLVPSQRRTGPTEDLRRDTSSTKASSS
ncbi:hypothetical protein GB931_03085 [Modestobacter sp. I12A-02628]|uniref:Carrier domain-containing protein n=1 Tax=Goekera deserti TaxID=2497753 RepID=A0A7K3WFR3_9ACTN|nr:acyl carrier protein [Goekera deserti]MPQ96922.1 hypothetical protein [Goekera deserti]NDI46764.1 hypothetical protein [Goekera deserti]NEL54333.1 hypothetical protein [Goekera deserti]